MNLLVHTTAGVIVAQYTRNPFLGFLYGFISHVILDLIPHGDSMMYKKYKNKEISVKKAAAKTVLDAVVSIVLVVIFFNINLPSSDWVLSLAIVGAVIPDILIGFHELLDPRAPKWLKIVHKWHFKNHDLIAKKFDFTLKHGLLFQTIVFLLLIQKIF